MSVETQLRETLLSAADEIGSVGPAAAVGSDSMRAQARSQRRRFTAILSAGLAVLLIAVAVPAVLSRVSSQDDRVVDRPTVPSADIYDVPTRGSLAADTDFVDAVRQLSWVIPGVRAVPPLPNPSIESRHVVFAGDVAGGRWALVVGDNTAQPTGAAADPDLQTDLGALSDIAAAWFGGPPGARPEQMLPLASPRGISADQPASLYNGTTGAVVVISAPGDVIEISPRPEVAADATVTRNYADADATDGVAVTTIEPSPFAAYGPPAVQYRVSRAGVVVGEQSPDGYGEPEGTSVPDPIGLNYLRPPMDVLPLGGPIDLEQDSAGGLLGEYGLRPDEVRFLVHYDGPVPGAEQAPAVLTVLTATLPSGAVHIRARWLQVMVPPNAQNAGYYGGGMCADDLFAAGTAAASRTIALRCVLTASEDDGTVTDTESTLAVIAPPELSSGFVSVTVGSTTSTFDLADGGVGMIPFPEGATSVTITGADGSIIDEVPILTE